MSYGKYGMKNTGTGNTNLNSNFAQYAYSDPQFALGMLLGQAWNKQYSDRGTKKAIDAAGQGLTLGPTQDELNQAASLLGNVPGSAAPAQMDIPNVANTPGSVTMSGSDNLPVPPQQQTGLEGTYADLSKYNIATPTVSYNSGANAGALDIKSLLGSAPASANTIDSNNLPVPPTAQQQGQAPAQAQDSPAAAPGTTGNYDIANPTTYSAAGGSADYNTQVNALAQQLANQRLRNFNKDEYLANQYMNLQKQGYSDEQIASIMQPLTMRAEALQTNVNKQTSDEILGYFKNRDFSKEGYNQNDLLQLVRLEQANPAAAKMLYANFITAPQAWSNDQSIKKMGISYDYGQKAAENNLKRNMTAADHNTQLSIARAKAQAAIGYGYKQKELQDRINYVAKAYGLNPSDPKVLQFILGGLKGGNGTGTGTGTATPGNNNKDTANKINAAKQILQLEQKWGENFDNNGKEFPDKAKADAARQYLSSVYTNNGNGNSGGSAGGNDATVGGNSELPYTAGAENGVGASFDPRFNDYNVAEYDWKQALKRNMNRPANERWSKEQMAQFALQRYGNGTQAHNIVDTTPWNVYGYK